MLHGSASDAAYQRVKEQILTGALPGGELLSEGEIANALGVSRTPVREAFLRLETEGWMRLYPKRGALVVPVGADESRQVLQARYILETGALCLVADAPSTTQRQALVQELTSNLTDQRKAITDKDWSTFSHLDADFHRIIVKAARNPLIEHFYDQLRERQRRMTSTSLADDSDRANRVVAGHERLTQSIKDADRQRFSRELIDHMTSVHGLEPRVLEGETI